MAFNTEGAEGHGGWQASVQGRSMLRPYNCMRGGFMKPT